MEDETPLIVGEVISTFWIVTKDVLSVICAGTESVSEAEMVILTVSEDS